MAASVIRLRRHTEEQIGMNRGAAHAVRGVFRLIRVAQIDRRNASTFARSPVSIFSPSSPT